MKPPFPHQRKAADRAHSAQQPAPAAPLDQEQPSELQTTIDELSARLTQAGQDRLRALADYQNLQRRTAEDRQKLVKLATQSLVEDLLEHFDHLSMASAHLQDQALSMIVDQLWKTLSEHGLTELDVLGKPFDPLTMEVVEHTTAIGSTEAAEPDNLANSVDSTQPDHPQTDQTSPANTVPTVTKIIRRGYSLNGVVLRVAKVAVA